MAILVGKGGKLNIDEVGYKEDSVLQVGSGTKRSSMNSTFIFKTDKKDDDSKDSE